MNFEPFETVRLERNVPHIATGTTMSEFDFERFVITLDPDGERCRRFMAQNAHLDCTIFQGIRGAELSLSDRIYEGLMTPECVAARVASDGEVGCAVSHKRLWERAATSPYGALIVEDDALTHPDIRPYIASRLSEWQEADIIMFSINTDNILEVEAPTGLRQILFFQQKYPNYDWITAALLKTDVTDTALWKLLKGFGTSCYFITPKGAQRLLATVFPLTLARTPIPLMNITVPGISIDKRLNALYEGLSAFITYPFLAWSPNNDSTTR